MDAASFGRDRASSWKMGIRFWDFWVKVMLEDIGRLIRIMTMM